MEPTLLKSQYLLAPKCPQSITPNLIPGEQLILHMILNSHLGSPPEANLSVIWQSRVRKATDQPRSTPTSFSAHQWWFQQTLGALSPKA